MCSMIATKLGMEGSAKGVPSWFPIEQAYVGFDHTFHLDREHALTIDFVNESRGPASRVAVELPPASARLLAESILAALDQAERAGVA